MSKWNKDTFIPVVKDNCNPTISNIIVDLVNFSIAEADVVNWGRGEGYGTMTYKCKSEDYGLIPLFHLTTNGQIKIPINFLRSKVRKKEIINDLQLKLESNFMMYFDEETCSTDVFYKIEDLFIIKSEVDKFIFTIQGIAARLHQ
tara:strand:- start:1850 stop:2284 length:435 start_codon:yes stop_codon:yes gene_type:complete